MNNNQQIKHESASNEFFSGSLNYLDDIKDVKATKQRHSPKPVIIMALVVIGLSGGVLAMLSIPNRPVENTPADSESEISNTQVQLSACIESAQANVEVGDTDFYPKLIANYKTQIDCYNTYDSENSAKKDLESKLSDIEVAARDAGISQAAIDAEYNRKAAQIEEEHRQYMAGLDARGAREEAESRRRWGQMDAEAAQQRSEQAAQQAQYEAQKKAREEAEARAQQEKIAKCNAYKVQYGDKSAEELARADATVVQAYNQWQDYAQKAEEWRNSGVVLTQAQCQSYTIKGRVCPTQYESKAKEAEVYYNKLYAQTVQAYNSSRKLACGY